MDNDIRHLIHVALEENDFNSLNKAYSKLKKERQSPSDKIDAVSPDLFTLCAETAFKLDLRDMAEDCIKMFFMKTPPSSQFLCRAYLCQAQLSAPTSPKKAEQLDKAFEYILKAINFARKNPRYYFLVYNASVLYWQFCRPFLKPNFRQYLARSLHQVVKALDDIDDKDYDWRAQLMIALIECHVDAGRKEDAVQVSNATLSFTKSYVPTLYTTVLGLQIRHRLIDISKVSKEIKASNELHIFYKIQRLRAMLEAGEKLDIHQELGKIYKMIVKGGLETDRSSTEMSSTPVCNFASSPLANGVSDKVPLLIDLTRLCLEIECHELAGDCLEILKGPTCIKDKTTSFEVEFMKFDLMVKSLGNKKENYSKNVVETRIQAIKKLEQYLITASRLGNPNVIQAGCVTLWNLSLPLLQPNLRYHVRKPLTLVARLLEDIDSLLILLRCQVHMEVAKCEEDEDQLESALTHLQKALDMDDSSQYRDRLNTALKRLKLRATLYQTPERPEDLSAMITEQARSSGDSSTVRMKRASLVKAGEALSPDAFVQVLDSESETKDPTSTKGPPTLLSKLAGRASHYQKAVSKADGHLKRLGNENDQERVRIWADLAKTSRKQHVWDVTRVAARFCLLYDNGRWSKRGASGRSNIQSDSDVAEDRSVVGAIKSPAPDKRVSGDSNKLDPTGMKLLHPEGMTPFKKEQDIIRNLGEIHFIYAEGLVHLLRKEGVQLGDSPIPPEETVRLRPKRYEDQQLNVQDQPEWLTYCKWIESLSAEAIYSFQRAAELGVELNEPWLICNSAVYLWNYTNHMLTQGRFKEIVPIYTPVLEAMKTTGHAGEIELMCRISNAIAQGLMQPWIPALPAQSDASGKEKTDKQQPEKAAKGRQSGKGAKGAPSKTNVPTVTVDPEGTGDLKKAVDMLEFMMTLTNGNDPNNLIPIALRHPLIKSWVFCKQLLNQPIPKNLGHDDENRHSQGPMSKALCAVEMISLQGNGLPELQPCPTLPEIVKMVETSTWSDRLVELEIWSRLAVLAYNNDNHSLVMHCGEKAMIFAASDQCLANKHPKKMDSVFKHKVVVEQEMLYFASVVMGQSLIKNMQGRNEIRRDALVCFVNACRFGQQANNYEQVITAARHYWNAIKPFISEPIERELLKDPLEAVLGCIAAVAEKTMGKEDEEEEEETETPRETKKTATKPKPGKSGKAGKDKKNKEKSPDKTKDKAKAGGKDKISKTSKVESPDGKDTKGKQDQESQTATLPSAFDEDLMLRAAMYGVLFQAYADKCDWEQGLRAMDQAIKDMPRTHHRLLIFKHRVITNAKLGRNVLFDMGKFKNECDDVISCMWRHVALNSNDPLDQLTAYQNAIEVLESPESDWQKVEYLVEFGEWLFVNEYPETDAMDQFLWAADILINRTSKEGASPAPDTDVDGMNDTSSLHAAKYVPRQRESVIGQRPSEISIKTGEMTDVRQLETLFRIHVMLAQVAGRSSPHYTEYILIASGFVHRILEMSIHSAEKMIREGGKPGERAPSKKGKDKKESQSKSEKTGSRSCMPSSMEAWSTFELPEKLQEYFKQDITGSMISKNTIKKPMLSMYYLDTLVNDVCELGYYQLGLPVLVMSQVIADLILEQEHLLRLVHLRIVQLCQQLNLLSGVSLHERLSGNLYLTEQEQAKSREEIEIWKEKQRQVSIEEERTRATKSFTFDHKSSNLDNRSRGPGLANNDVEYEPWNKYKTVISGVKNREVWTAQAEILIHQGHYQVARQLLYEANISARAFEDHSTLAKILVQLAILALGESNWGQAISLLKEAQSLKGDQKFWLQTTLLLVEACLAKIDKRSQNPNKPDKEALEKACGMIIEAKSLFQGLSEENENKANLSDYIEAILEGRLGILLFDYQINDATEERRDEEMLTNCDNAYQHLRRAGIKLAQLGYRREAVKLMRKQADVKKMFADKAKTTEERHEYFLQAYSILMEATNIAEAVMYDAQEASPLTEMRLVSLPVQREVVEVHLHLTDLMVNMFLCYSQEDRTRRQLEARKGSMQKMVDDFVKSETALCNEEKQEWEDTSSSLAVDAIMQLSLVSGMANGLPHLKAKIMYSLGVCLRALSAHTSPDAENQWKELEQNSTLDVEKETILENQSEESKKESKHLDGVIKANTSESGGILKYTTQAFNLNREYTTSRKYLCQAVECLSQAVQIGLKGGLRDIVSQASHQLVECIGKHDPSSSAQYLALYQSCYMSECLEKVLYRAQADPALSRLAALLRQRQLLNTIDYLTEHSSAVVSLNQSNLGDCEAWRRLSIMKSHLDLTKEFSVTNLQFVVLQHSPDRQYLYGALLDKGRSAVASAKPAKQAGAVAVPAKAVVTRAKVNPKDLDNLIEEFNHFKSDTATELTRRNFVRHQHEQQQIMLGRVEENLPNNQESNVIMDAELEHQEAKLQSHFQDALAAMEAYLDPVLTALNAESMSDTIVLLADDNLLLLPLESLNVFLTPRVTSLTRDFSLQFLYHRLHHSEENEHKSDAKKGGGKKGDKKPEKPSTAKSKPSDKKGGTKDAAAGVPKEGPVVDVNNLRYIVDLHNECSDEEESPVKVMTDIIAHHKTFSSKWTGVMGSDHLPSIGEFQNLLHESSVFLFYGTERCLGSLPPSLLCPMNLTECNVAFIMDLVHTNSSFLRQSRDDSAKTVSEISLENPLECAMLFSLAGLGCVLTNTWHGQLQDNKNKLIKYFTVLLEDSKPIGQALRSLIEFSKPSEADQDAECNSEKGSKHGDGARRNSNALVQKPPNETEVHVPLNEPLPPAPRHWFNTVMYGAPNILFNPTKSI